MTRMKKWFLALAVSVGIALLIAGAILLTALKALEAQSDDEWSMDVRIGPFSRSLSVPRKRRVR